MKQKRIINMSAHMLINEIIKETSEMRSSIKISTVENLMMQGLSEGQIIALHKVSFQDKSCGCEPIPIGSLKRFTLRFIGDYFEEEDVDSCIAELITMSHQTKFFTKGWSVCTTTLVKYANRIGAEHDVNDLRDIEDLIISEINTGYEDDIPNHMLPGFVDKDEPLHWFLEQNELVNNTG